MDRVALGFSNTVDYEIEWDPRHLEKLIRHVGLCMEEIEEKRTIRNMKDLLSSILFHMSEGSGCGLLTDLPEVIDEFIQGTKYRVALGGTNLRAAEVISALGGNALVHLVSVNEDTVKRMPLNISWVGGEHFPYCFAHIAVQFPKNARVRANDIDITAPRANRVIYSGDLACAQLPLEKEFLTRAMKARALLLSSFDLVRDPEVLMERLTEIKNALGTDCKDKPLVFYEHACFGDERLGDHVRRELGPFIDIYSMNEDEFQTLVGRKLDLLDVESVMEGLRTAARKVPGTTIIVHTCHWALLYGRRTKECARALENGMLTASTRYRRGFVSRDEIQVTRGLPQQRRAEVFAEKIEANFGGCIRCLPAVDIKVDQPTTVGLGDSFVGGFLYKYCFDN